MHPTYFRATAYGDTKVPYIEEWYIVYKTSAYDHCTCDKHFASQMQNKTPKEIRDICKQSNRRLKRINNRYSRYARKTPKEAIQHLIYRKSARMKYLQQYITEVNTFLLHANTVGVDSLIAESNNHYGTHYAVTSP